MSFFFTLYLSYSNTIHLWTNLRFKQNNKEGSLFRNGKKKFRNLDRMSKISHHKASRKEQHVGTSWTIQTPRQGRILYQNWQNKSQNPVETEWLTILSKSSHHKALGKEQHVGTSWTIQTRGRRISWTASPTLPPTSRTGRRASASGTRSSTFRGARSGYWVGLWKGERRGPGCPPFAAHATG